MKIGGLVKFTGCDKKQIQWGGNDDPTGKLKVGEVYIVVGVEVHSWHTKISLDGITGKFNSVCFDSV